MNPVHRILHLGPFPVGAGEAAAAFYRRDMAVIGAELVKTPASLTLVLRPADADHHGWRRAAVADLARAHAPVRINAVVGDDPAALDAVCAWIERSPGITGQTFGVDGHGGGNPAYSPK